MFDHCKQAVCRGALASFFCTGLALGPAAAVQAGELPDAVEPQVLLITDAALAEAWQDFADFKTRLGRPTTIMTVQEIAQAYEGADIQAKIRAAALDHVENHGTQYIILGGDSQPGTEAGGGLVPDRDTAHPQMRYRDVPTDLYYISPGDKDWDANDDGIYGLWPQDMSAVQYGHPSGAAIGRIPVRTPDDVAAYTDKIIDYETAYPAQDFAQSIIYTNTVDASEPKVRRSWDDYLSKSWEQGGVLRFLHTQTAWDVSEPGDYALNADHWVEVINRRTAGKMHMHGHGFLPVWALEHPTGNTRVNARVVDRLQNENAYLVMTTVSCFTGQYDAVQDPSITETMLRAPDKGAVVIIAPSREGVPIFHNPREDFRLMVTQGKLDGTTESMTRFWMHGLSAQDDGGYLTAGQAFITMKNDMDPHARQTAGYHWCQCELNFLGDPTLDLRAKDPVSATDRFAQASPNADTFAAGQAYHGHTLQTGLEGTDGVVVCLWKGDEVYQVAPVQADGTATFEDFTFETPGRALLTISGPSMNAYLGSVTVR